MQCSTPLPTQTMHSHYYNLSVLLTQPEMMMEGTARNKGSYRFLLDGVLLSSQYGT